MGIVVKEMVTLEMLPNGSLFMFGDSTFGLKTEYVTADGAIEAYIVGSGEMFWGGTNGDQHRQREVLVNRIEITV